MEDIKKLVSQILGDLEGTELSEKLEELIQEIVAPYLNKLPKTKTDDEQ